MKVFIPFADGLLNYDCNECGRDCCQEGAIIMNSGEKVSLLKEFPHLKHFLTKDTGKVYRVSKYQKCWFLEADGSCHIHNKYGHSSKPLGCRMHPFFVVRCHDEYIVLVDDCPVIHASKGSPSVTHDRILKDIYQAISNDYVTDKIDWPASRLNLEKRILADAKMYLKSTNYLDFSAHQISLTTENKDINNIRTKLSESVELWKSFLKIDDLDLENQDLTYELTVLTSLLRVESLRLRRMEARQVPQTLLALYVYMILFSNNMPLKKRYINTFVEMLDDLPPELLYNHERSSV